MKTNKFLNILWILSIAFLWLPQAHADVTVYQYGFELGIGDWSPDNGVWEVGVPTGANEPPEIPEGFLLLGTVVNGPSQGVYPPDTDSRVSSPEIQLPPLLADEEIFLTFWQWFSYADGCTCDYGQVQVRYYNENTSSWSNWVSLNDSVCGISRVWSKRRDELTAYAGKKIQIGFNHNAYSGQGCGNASTGWYIDDVRITKKVPEFTGDFEFGWGDWGAYTGVWEVGTPTAGPPNCYTGSQCAGTVLDGNYPSDTDSRLLTSPVTLPNVLVNEEIFLTFWQWFSYADGCTCDYGQIQIRYYNESTSSWSNWIPLNDSVCGISGVWSKRRDELTTYAGKKIQIGFNHNAYSGQGCGNASTGWYIDDVQITKKVPEFTGDFEFGWGDWGAYTGVWEVGTPTAGPPNCYTGNQCAGTVLDGNYPSDTDSRFVSSSFRLPEAIGAEKIVLTFYQWFSFADACNCDYGKVQIQEYDEAGQEWLTWQDITTICGVSGNWTKSPSIDLTQYNDRIVRIGFLHTAYSGQGCGNRSTGWYIDHIRITKLPPEICWCDLNGDGICNILDWPLFIQDWGRTNCGTPPGTGDPPNDCECDIRTDGACNILDWPLFIEDWGKANWCPK